MSGRRAIGLMMLILAGLFGAANLYAFSQEWRQRERLVADGLRQPRGMVWMPDQAIVVAEAGLPGTPNSGRLTWASASSARQTMVDALPSDDAGGPVALALGPAGLLVLTGPCAQPRCASLLGPDANGQLTVLAELKGRSPWGLALGTDGAAWVTDRASGELLRVPDIGVPDSGAPPPAPPGSSKEEARGEDAKATAAGGDAAGRTADAGAGSARDAGAAATRMPVVVARFGPSSDPRGIALGPDGAVYVALFGVGTVARVGPDGAVATAVAGLTQPVGVGVDSGGRLLVLEAAGQVVRVGSDGQRELFARDLDAPSALLVAPDGRTYVTAAGQLLQVRRLGPVGPRRFV